MQTYNLSGVVNLQDLSAADIAVNLADRAKGAASIKFADEAVKGKADTLTLGLDNVGTVDADKGDTPVAVTINGIEELTVNAAGENAVTLNGGNAVKALTVTGDGDLNAALADTSLESVDASAATGDLSVDLTAANSKLASVILGSGNDTLTLGVDAAIDCSINGGRGRRRGRAAGSCRRGQGTADGQCGNPDHRSQYCRADPVRRQDHRSADRQAGCR